MGNLVKKGRIIYYDPNEEALNTNTMVLNGPQSNISNNISVDQEDLNMYVNLKVSIPRRDINFNTNNPIYQKSFMSGSEINCNEKTYNLLTTSYTDAHFNEIKENSERNRELFGIKNIEISFDQQFFPQVTIQFTDVKGYSLFQPTEYAYATNGNQNGNYNDNVASSFFSSLFRFPYPVFTLEVQGFYGDAVSFELAVNEFKSSFVAESGNFDVTITFIGYMYGVYTDIPISYVLTAPFFDNNGNVEETYWYQKVSDGTFTFPQYSVDSNGKKNVSNISTAAIPTYIDFLRKYADLVKLNGDVNDPELSNLYSDINDIYSKSKKELDALTAFKSACNIYYDELKAKFSDRIIEGKDHFLIYYPLNKRNTKEDIKKIIDGKFEKLSNYRITINERGQGISNDIITIPTLTLSEIQGTISNTNKEFFDYYGISEGNYDGYFYLAKKVGWKRTNINTLQQLVESNDKNYNPDDKIDERIKELNKKIEDNKDVINNKATEIATKILGFKPSIENMYRMFYAYLDTFMHYIGEKTKEIGKGERTREYLGIGDDKQYKTDVPSNFNAIPPFPMLAKVVNKKREIIYPGEVSSNFQEIAMVEEIYNNIKKFSNSFDDAIKVINTAENDEKKSVFNDNIGIPFLNVDLISNSAPFGENIRDKNNDIDVDKLRWAIAMRLCTFEYLQKLTKGYISNNKSEIEGKIEGYNFVNNNLSIEEKDFEKIKESLDNGNFYNFLTSQNIIKDNQYRSIKNGTQAVLLEKWDKATYDSINDNSNLKSIYTKNVNASADNNIISFITFDENNFNKLTKTKNDSWIDEEDGEKDKFYSRWNLEDNVISEYSLQNIEDTPKGIIYLDDFKPTINKIGEQENSIYKQGLFFLLFNIFRNKSEYKLDNFDEDNIFVESLIRILRIGAFYKFENDDLIFNDIIDDTSSNYKKLLKKWRQNISIINSHSFLNNFSSEAKTKIIKMFEDWCNGSSSMNDLGDFPTLPILLQQIKQESSWTEVKRGDDIGYIVNTESAFYNSLKAFYESKLIVIYNNIIEKPEKVELDKESVGNFIDGFIKELENSYDFSKNNTTAIKEAADNKATEIKKSIYYTLKNIYDKWLCCAGSNHNFSLNKPSKDVEDRNNAIKSNTSSKNRSEYSRIIFANSFFMDISNEMVMDMKSLRDVIEIEINGEQSASFYEVMASLAEKNKSLFLSVPVFNNNMNDLFRPCPYTRCTTINSGPTYIFLYPGENSHILNDNYSEFTDDGISDLSGTYGIDSIGGDEVNDFPFRAFGVTYGMQNQNYFKTININMDTPSMTDYSIANTLHLADSSKNGDINNASVLGQSLYPIFANRAYVCSVEMMGCAGITPFMHFQLNNIPMFKGVYVITNVTHRIGPGTFTTSFTGTRVAKYNYPANETVFDMDELVNRIGRNNEIYNTNSIDNSNVTTNEDVGKIVFENPTNDIPNDGREYKYDELLSIKDDNGESIVVFQTGRNKNKERYDDECDVSIRRFLYNLAEKIKSENKKKKEHKVNGEPYKIIVTSTYNYASDNSGRTCKSAHRHGFAVDLITEDKQNSSNLFAHCASFIDDIDQLIWESKKNSNTTENIINNCIHVSTAKCSYPNPNNCNEKSNRGQVRHMVWQASDPQGTEIMDANLMAQNFKNVYKQLVDNKKLDSNDKYLKIRNDIIKTV